MKTASRITLTLAGVCVLLAVWQPVGTWWQWAITALLFLLAGAGFGAAADMPRQHTEGSEVGPMSVTYSSDIPAHLQTEEGVELFREERRREFGRTENDR